MNLEPLPRRDGKPESDRYFRNTDTGNNWRVRVRLAEAKLAQLVPPAPADMAAAAPASDAVVSTLKAEVAVDVDAPQVIASDLTVNVSVVLVDADLKTVVTDDRLMGFDQRGRTFGELDFMAHDFDPAAVIQAIIQERIGAAERVLASRSLLTDFVAVWNRDGQAEPA